MAISTLDQLLAGFKPPQYFQKVRSGNTEGAGVLVSTFYDGGIPGAGTQPSPGLAGTAITAVDGQIPVPSASNNTYLGGFGCTSTLIGTVLLVDRLWHNSGITSTTTTAQTINSAAWPARDADGSTNGAGVMVGVEVYAATTNGSAITNMTMGYTNSAGSDTRTGTILSFPQTAAAGTFVPFRLQAGDVGVRSIQSLTLGTSLVTGTVHLVAYRVLAALQINVANTYQSLDAIGLGLPRMYDNSVPFLLFLSSGTTAYTLTGIVNYAQG